MRATLFGIQFREIGQVKELYTRNYIVCGTFSCYHEYNELHDLKKLRYEINILKLKVIPKNW